MRFGVIAQSILDRVALATRLVPVPIIEATPPLLQARAIMVATKSGVFEALAAGPRDAPAIAAQCQADPRAMRKLLDGLVGTGYLRYAAGRYTLAPLSRRWLLRDSPRSIHDYMLFNYSQWEWIARLDEFLTDGQPIEFHREMTPEQWDMYQRGMYCIARLTAPEVAWRVPVPRGAKEMLDIGGSHGLYSVAICRRHPGLRATVLDLPVAIEYAAPLLAREGMGDRVQHRAGDALTDDLGEARYDLVFIANLVHHFDNQTNRDLMRRIARALRPGGICVIQDGYHEANPQRAGQFGALGDLFFALTSAAGVWTFAEMAAWQRAAGLVPRRPIKLITGPNQGIQAAKKPG
jgi:SAM-dependent methyltransferase